MKTLKTQPINVLLELKAHQYARQFAIEQPSPQKGKQVYLNTLAVYAVYSYLQSWSHLNLDLKNSDCWDSHLRTILNVADLILPEIGTLECRPVLPGELSLIIPPEVSDHRLAYIGVQFQEKLERVKLLGFATNTFGKTTIPLSNLQPMENLLTILNKKTPRVNLRQWLEGIFEPEWQSVESLLLPSQGSLPLAFAPLVVSRAKVIEFQNQHFATKIILVLQIIQQPAIEIHLRVYPEASQVFLPPNLQINLLDEENYSYMEARSRHADLWLELAFAVELGDSFSLKIELDEHHLTETFTF